MCNTKLNRKFENILVKPAKEWDQLTEQSSEKKHRQVAIQWTSTWRSSRPSGRSKTGWKHTPQWLNYTCGRRHHCPESRDYLPVLSKQKSLINGQQALLPGRNVHNWKRPPCGYPSGDYSKYSSQSFPLSLSMQCMAVNKVPLNSKMRYLQANPE